METKIKIYECAKRLFEKYGFDHVSVDSIVEMAGVSKGSFYVHFDSKNSLITTLIADNVKKIDLSYQSYLQSFPAGTKAYDILISLAGKVADTISNTIGYDVMRIIYEVQLTKTVNTDAMLSYNRDIYKTLSSVINQGIKQGDFKTETNIDIVTNHCIMSLRGMTYEWCIRYPDFNLKEQVQAHFEMLMAGIKR